MSDYFLAAFLLMIFTISSQIYGKINSSSFYKKEKKSQIKSDGVFKLVYVWIKYSTLILVLVSILFDQPKELIIFSDTNVLALGILCCLVSLGMFIRATKDLGANYSPCYDSYKPMRLVTNGIYSSIRHPIYTSNILLLIGLFLISGNIVILLNTVVLTIFYYRAATFEEKEFLNTFPQYRQYYSSTKKFLPRIF